MLSEEILYLPIRELGARIRKRAISPVELAESYLDRSRKLGPKFNAYVTLTEERALAQARAAEKEIAAGHYRGPLHGIPYAAKDLVAVKGYPTTWGAPPFAEQRFDSDATVIERLDQAGAVLLGKAAMIELAGGLGYSNGNASLTGPARNPWNTECWTCGSSSGSGAIVSAGLAPWAIGSDTRGSIICPTTWCGISGMRPSFGRVSRHGAMAIAWSMDKLGPMARTADCCGLALSVMAGHDPRDHDSLPPGLAEFPWPPSGPERPLRIGRLTNAWTRLDAGLESAIDEALKTLEKSGAKVTDAQLPDGPFEDAAELTILMEAASSFQKLVHSGGCARLVDPLGQVNGYPSEMMTATDYLQVQRVRTILQRRIDLLFDQFDVIAAAGSNSKAQRLVPAPRGANPPQKKGGDAAAPRPADNSQRAPDGISSLCGLPALSVPCGFSSDNLPYGLQFIARAANDAAVVLAARKFQSLTEWHKKHPGPWS
ncbi:MAG TPA: amidase [Verrucomicrobiae bacterium]|nr:amidase [Verrucomicrobiae bacterium]